MTKVMTLTNKGFLYYTNQETKVDRIQKKIFIGPKEAIDGETATMFITIGRMIDREAFIDSLPLSYCVDGKEGLHKAFREWKKDNKVIRLKPLQMIPPYPGQKNGSGDEIMTTGMVFNPGRKIKASDLEKKQLKTQLQSNE